jgi:hypothetical protein
VSGYKVGAAALWLDEALAAASLEGRVLSATEIRALARAAGHSWASVRTAKDLRGVRSYRRGNAWYWDYDPELLPPVARPHRPPQPGAVDRRAYLERRFLA